jgi:hypothetical protein
MRRPRCAFRPLSEDNVEVLMNHGDDIDSIHSTDSNTQGLHGQISGGGLVELSLQDDSAVEVSGVVEEKTLRNEH